MNRYQEYEETIKKNNKNIENNILEGDVNMDKEQEEIGNMLYDCKDMDDIKDALVEAFKRGRDFQKNDVGKREANESELIEIKVKTSEGEIPLQVNGYKKEDGTVTVSGKENIDKAFIAFNTALKKLHKKEKKSKEELEKEINQVAFTPLSEVKNVNDMKILLNELRRLQYEYMRY